MGIISFFKEAGEKLFGGKDAAAAQPAGPDAAELQARAAAANKTAADAITTYIGTQKLSADGLAVEFDGASGSVTVSGVAPDQATKEKIVLCCGNVHGVAQVNDMNDGGAAGRRVAMAHRRQRRHAVGDRQEVLRQRECVPEDLRGQHADA